MTIEIFNNEYNGKTEKLGFAFALILSWFTCPVEFI